MTNQTSISRVEKKYELDMCTTISLKRILSSTLTEDTHNYNDGYMVRSLYFDTLYNNDYYDKENGLEHRRKIRMRTYNPCDSTLKIELKEKQGEYQQKDSLTINKEVAKEIIYGRYDALKSLNNDFANRLYTIMSTELYRPVCIVEYDRLAYIVNENNTRITIDRNLRSSESDLDLFNEHLILNPISEKNILEVKYNNFLLSYVKDIIDNVNRTQTSASKYCMARNISYLGGA